MMKPNAEVKNVNRKFAISTIARGVAGKSGNNARIKTTILTTIMNKPVNITFYPPAQLSQYDQS